jgi:hypothetical protein
MNPATAGKRGEVLTDVEVVANQHTALARRQRNDSGIVGRIRPPVKWAQDNIVAIIYQSPKNGVVHTSIHHNPDAWRCGSASSPGTQVG